MEAVITELTTGLTPASFFAIVADVMPFVLVMIPVSLGLYLLRRLIKGAGSGKTKI